MPDSVDLGFNGLKVQPGIHICGIYTGDRQRDEIVIPFLETGLRDGDKCMCIVDSIEPAEIIDKLDPGLDPGHRADVSQLVVMRASHVFCRSGRFSASETIGFWKVAISEAMYDSRFEMVRAVDIWSQHDIVVDPAEHLLLESEMNRIIALYKQVVVCLYDLEQFGSALIFNLLKTHPVLLLDGLLLENPYYKTPDEVMAETEATVGARCEFEKVVTDAES
jgi:MEDS: MEthanogen/methylotroph, DcmR Sensory domain